MLTAGRRYTSFKQQISICMLGIWRMQENGYNLNSRKTVWQSLKHKLLGTRESHCYFNCNRSST